jgi:hypothetical protein
MKGRWKHSPCHVERLEEDGLGPGLVRHGPGDTHERSLYEPPPRSAGAGAGAGGPRPPSAVASLAERARRRPASPVAAYCLHPWRTPRRYRLASTSWKPCFGGAAGNPRRSVGWSGGRASPNNVKIDDNNDDDKTDALAGRETHRRMAHRLAIRIWLGSGVGWFRLASRNRVETSAAQQGWDLRRRLRRRLGGASSVPVMTLRSPLSVSHGPPPACRHPPRRYD